MKNCKTNTLFSLIILSCLFFSCGNHKKVVYFQKKSSLEKSSDSITSYYYSPVYQINDLLSIVVSAADPELVKPYNLINSSAKLSNDENTTLGYSIDSEGEIDFPVLGKIHLAGLNREQAVTLIKDKLFEHVPQTNVNIQILNFKVTVLGDVRKPGTFNVKDDRVSLLEAIGYAEDLNITGVRNNVLIVREEKGKKIEIRVDLSSNDFLNSKHYYLSQNDVVYVQPNRLKSNSEIFGRNAGTLISFTSLLFSTLIIIFSK